MKRLLLTTAALLTAMPAKATDLEQAWRAALLHDPEFGSAEAARDAGAQARVQARALKRPSVQLQGAYQYSQVETDAQLPDDLSPFFAGQRSSGRATVAVQASQPIWDASKRAQSIQLRAQAQAAEVSFGAAQQNLILRVAQGYFAVLAGEDTLASYARQTEAAEQQRRAAQARFDAGRARITDVREAEARRDAAEAQRIAAEADLHYARASFTELTGLTAQGLDRPDPGFVAPPPIVSLASASETAERQSPTVLAAEQNARAAGAEIDRYRLSGRPVVDGVAGYQGQYRLGGDTGNGILPDRVQSVSAGVRVTVPLYAGGAIRSKEREAQSRSLEAQRDVDVARRDARLAATKAWHATATGARRIAALRAAQASADAQQAAAGTGREVGIRTQTDVLNAQSQSLATDRDHAHAIYDYLVARLQLAGAMGALGPEDLGEVNALLRTQATSEAEISTSAGRGRDTQERCDARRVKTTLESNNHKPVR
nr:TolC family outer membrane protein [uncultured Sphingomonas sp.]